MTKQTILIAEDDFELAQGLKLRCQQMGLDVMRSPDALHALLGAHRIKPDLILTDVHLPSGNGLSLCEFLNCDSELSQVPVIIMSGQSDEAMVRRSKSLGAQFVKKGPQLWAELEPLIHRLLGHEPAESADSATGDAAEEADAEVVRPKVLCIDDDPAVSQIIQIRLAAYGVDVQRTFKGMQGFWSSLDMRPDVIITDMQMPDGAGNYILSRIRSHSLTKETPVIVLTGQRDMAMKREMLNLGANAYLTKPIDFDELLDQLRQYIPLTARPTDHGGIAPAHAEPSRN